MDKLVPQACLWGPDQGWFNISGAAESVPIPFLISLGCLDHGSLGRGPPHSIHPSSNGRSWRQVCCPLLGDGKFQVGNLIV